MWENLKQWSQQRSSWFVLAFSALVLEVVALYFQHGLGLKPCVMCIYERIALWGVFFGGVIGFLAPSSWLLRLLGIGVGLWSAVKGLFLAVQHVDYQLNPAPWNRCDLFVNFPQTLPLDHWLPAMFKATGDCSQVQWQFLGYSMPQWLIVVFAVYIVILSFVLLSQLKRGQATRRRLFK
ncbi:disulfide bond formation protein B [Mergibacter septicus]|uniref:Disulfide bond formation protein B n=1 Tax=Mergibacter septicus TaxID=221402 RepID=A0A8D4J0K8_9PAST|nr:disulfide bond formation protein DsbB [Mergibacter septicus]AWX15822.1 disulfide bond formation protein B [Mergibacter septicus]QDJ15075.1 disulfide bond formation protein B [Mergibacter septicus]UTU47501.1 disulfide bond formation protein DsbB [Mergibacter septicus]WMR95318.1 disulfide bond formation protein DsbB [Mergibacter septicus]